MTTRIIYSQGTQTGRMLAQAVNAMLDARDQATRLKLILDSAQSGAPADWDALAAEVGGAITAQQAQDLWTIFSNATARVDDPAVLELKRLDQG